MNTRKNTKGPGCYATMLKGNSIQTAPAYQQEERD